MLYEDSIPVHPAVQAACEMLGFDPLYVANEGKLIAIVERNEADRVLAVMKSHPLGTDAAIIGTVLEKPNPPVIVKTSFGTTRIMDMLSGEMLPRIC
jgi:hydrogenase expression/formation protein HypE